MSIGSVLLSVHLSGSFLGIGSLVFCVTWHGVRGPYLVICDSDKNESDKND